MKKSVAVAVLFLAAALPVAAGEMPEGMVSYQLVLLRGGPGETKYADERELQAMQEERLAWLGRLHAEGTAIVSGPIWQGGDLRGALVLDVPSRQEAEAVLAGDPWVRAGREVPEIHPWWCGRETFRKTTNLVRLVRTWLVLLSRPENAPAYDEAKLQEIQAAHLAHIAGLAASGDLVAAGPFGDGGKLRGVLVLRTLEAERVRSLIAQDPAVRAGRLGAAAVQWSVPEGSLP